MTEFEEFYEKVFKPNLEILDHFNSGVVFSSGLTIKGASWDRKAAYLLMLVANGHDAPLEQMRRNK